MAWSRYSSHRDSRTTKNMDTVYHNSATFTNSRVDTFVGVRLTISNSTASRNEMMMTRAFTSHASHDRSLNLLTIFLRVYSAVCCCSRFWLLAFGSWLLAFGLWISSASSVSSVVKVFVFAFAFAFAFGFGP